MEHATDYGVRPRLDITGVEPFVYSAIVESPIDTAALSRMVEHAGIGAISTFVGTVRSHNDGRDVTGIDYEAYHAMAERELELIAREACDAAPGLRLAVVHRVGALLVGEASVAIAAAHARRGPAMAAAQRVIEQLKKRVPIWKREHYADGERQWVDPTR